MAIAANSSTMSFVYLADGELFDWGISVKDCGSKNAAYARTLAWLNFYKPTVLIIEELPEASRKGQHVRTLLGAAREAAQLVNVQCVHMQHYYAEPNKYAEAARLAAEYPQIAPWLPAKRRIWEKEPRHIIYFEALSLADAWLRQARRNIPIE